MVIPGLKQSCKRLPGLNKVTSGLESAEIDCIIKFGKSFFYYYSNIFKELYAVKSHSIELLFFENVM